MEKASCSAPHSVRESCSAPVLKYLTSASASEGGEEWDDRCNLEVFVVARPFVERGMAIVRQYPSLALQLGVCHFLTVFKTKAGGMYQFDFGPPGGRHIQVQGGPLARLINEGDQNKGASSVVGEIREAKIVDLPESHLYLGKSKLTIEDIRKFNDTHCKNYELNINDCRHYVNNLVLYTTGVHSASAQLVRDQLKKKKDELPHFSSNIIRLLQTVTNASNWSKIRATGNATVATILYLTGSGVATRTRAAFAGPAISQIPKYGVGKAAIVALASVAVSCPQVPIIKRMTSLRNVVTSGANRAVTGAGSAVAIASRTVLSRVVVEHPRELPYIRRGRLIAAGTKRIWL